MAREQGSIARISSSSGQRARGSAAGQLQARDVAAAEMEFKQKLDCMNCLGDIDIDSWSARRRRQRDKLGDDIVCVCAFLGNFKHFLSFGVHSEMRCLE